MPSDKGFEQYWTTKDVAERLHATADAVKKWMSSGKLERTKAGGKTLISESALQRFLDDENEEPARSAGGQADGDLHEQVQTALACLVSALAPFDYVVRQIAVKRLETELDLRFWSETRRLDPDGYRSYLARREPQPPAEARPASD